MELPEFVKKIDGFYNFPVFEKILVVGYYLHTVKRKERFVASDINAAFDSLHIAKPTNASSQLTAMTKGFVKKILGTTKGFKLNSSSRENIETKLPKVLEAKEILTQLRQLETKVTNAQQKTFLHEANVCFANEAYRAAIVMGWNLAYHHICTFIFDSHLAAFNARLPIQAKSEKAVVKFSDFEDIQESVVIAVAKGASVISQSTAKTLKAKLDIRNSAAHPSAIVVLPVTAEEVISDLVQNILLKSEL